MDLSEEKKLIKNDVSDDIKNKVSTFPSMPQTVVKIREILKKEDVSTEEIENILRQDPGLSTNILRLANSAQFGVASKVGSLKKAVALLGLKRFEQIAISAYMNKTLDGAVEGYNLSPGILWLHSIAAATTAEALAKYLKIADLDDVFIPALLHDMGKLIVGKFIKKESQHIESLVAKGESLINAEYTVLGTDHAEIGALILEKWSFPPDIVNAVRWHHDAEYISDTYKCLKDPTVQSDIVYLSNIICKPVGDGDAAAESLVKPPSEVLQRLRIKLDQYEVIVEKSRNWINKLSDTLSFE